jgi:hypothetical protein
MLTGASMTLSKTVVAERLQWRTRANFPGALLADEAQRTWAEHSDAPLRLVGFSAARGIRVALRP